MHWKSNLQFSNKRTLSTKYKITTKKLKIMTKRFLKATFIIAFVIITGQIAFNAQSTNASNIDELTLKT